MNIGILGYGRFGKIWSTCLAPYGDVRIFDTHVFEDIENVGVRFEPIETVFSSDFIFLCVPMSAFEKVCEDIKDEVGKNSVLIDVCSVKVEPAETMKKIFEETQELIATHPLFGPDSISKTGLPGKKIVVANLTASEEHLAKLEDIFTQMELNIIHCTPEEHDKQMAKSQALIHYLGRAFAELGLEDQEISTPDYQSFVRINDLVNNDTWQLFFDMQTKNPFAREVRLELLKALHNLEEKIETYEQ